MTSEFNYTIFQNKLDSLNFEYASDSTQSTHENLIDVSTGAITGTDIFSIIVTLLFGFIAVWFAVNQSKQIERQKEIAKRIEGKTNILGRRIDQLNSEVTRLKDISRPFKQTFPEMVKAIIELCDKALIQPETSEFFIMNRTVAFAHIHMYNPKFIDQYKLSNDKLSPGCKEILRKRYEEERKFLKDLPSNDDVAKYVFREDVDILHKKLVKAAKALKQDKFKLITLSGQGEESDLLKSFISPYIREVNSDINLKSNNGLIFYEYDYKVHKDPGKIIDINLSELETEERISEEIIKHHNAMINSISTSKKQIKKSDWLTYNQMIPMQMYLLKRIVNGNEEYNSFIINAGSIRLNNQPGRYLDGLFSTEKSLYNVFKTLFNENFEN